MERTINKKSWITVLVTILVILSSTLTVFADHSSSSHSSRGWKKDSRGYYYLLENGNRAVGWKTIDNKKYYFKSNGYMCSGFTKIGDSKYYFTREKGALTGSQKIKNKWYRFSSSGRMVTGWYKKPTCNKWYWYNSDGSMARNCWKTLGGTKFYFDGSGVMATGFTKIRGRWYEFDEDGRFLHKYKDNEVFPAEWVKYPYQR